MKIIRLLLKSSSKNLFLAITASFISGVSSAGVIALINFAIRRLGVSPIANLQDLPVWLPWLFAGLCCV